MCSQAANRGEMCVHMALSSCHFGVVPLCESIVRGFPKRDLLIRLLSIPLSLCMLLGHAFQSELVSFD